MVSFNELLHTGSGVRSLPAQQRPMSKLTLRCKEELITQNEKTRRDRRGWIKKAAGIFYGQVLFKRQSPSYHLQRLLSCLCRHAYSMMRFTFTGANSPPILSRSLLMIMIRPSGVYSSTLLKIRHASARSSCRAISVLSELCT